MAANDRPKNPRVLAVDVGGSHVKVLLSTGEERLRFTSGATLTAAEMVERVVELTKDLEYDVVSVGVPAQVMAGKVVHDPVDLGEGWAGFDFEAAFGKPTQVVNDAAMQALGSYEGGRMLFLGLGTGLGSAMVADGVLEPMELGHLPYRKETYEDFVGARGLERRRGAQRGARARLHRARRRERQAAARAAAELAPRRQPERLRRRLPPLGGRGPGTCRARAWHRARSTLCYMTTILPCIHGCKAQTK